MNGQTGLAGWFSGMLIALRDEWILLLAILVGLVIILASFNLMDLVYG